MSVLPSLDMNATIADRSFLGIDPGVSGGLAVVRRLSGSITLTAVTDLASLTTRDVWNWLLRNCQPFTECRAVLERVHAFPQQGVVSMFTFGRSYGFLQGLLTAAEIPWEEVLPKRWQKEMNISPRATSETKLRWKRRLCEHAQRLFPQAAITPATGDAVLLAEFCRRTQESREVI